MLLNDIAYIIAIAIEILLPIILEIIIWKKFKVSWAIFLSDKHPSFRLFARQKGLQYKSLDLSKGIRVVKGIYHIQNVNSYHNRLKIWMNRFKGVATKYLSNYLHWFEFIDSIGKDKIQKVAERDLLLRACSVKSV